MGIALFIAEPTGRCRVALRRFRHRQGDGGHFHDAMGIYDDDLPVTPRNPDGTSPGSGYRVAQDDPRWPAACECGEPFTDDDERQVNELDWHEGCGHRFAWGIGSWSGPPGAMIRAPWRDDSTPDNGLPSWLVFLPNGQMWNTRERSTNPDGSIGPQWQVSGTPPRVTVSPSINDQSPSRPWHGFIRSGFLEPA